MYLNIHKKHLVYSKALHFFQKYEAFVTKSDKVFMAETVAPTPDRMFVEIRYRSLYMETYMVKQITSPPITRFTLAEIFICKQRNNKILTWYGAAITVFRESTVNRCYNNVYPVFIPCNQGQGDNLQSTRRNKHQCRTQLFTFKVDKYLWTACIVAITKNLCL